MTIGNEVTTTMDTNNTIQETQFVLRRLEEALRVFGHETDAHWFWVFVLAVILMVGFAYVIWMYQRGSQSDGCDRASSYAVLCLTKKKLLEGQEARPAQADRLAVVHAALYVI